MTLIKLADISDSTLHETPESLINRLVGSEDVAESSKALVILVRKNGETFDQAFFSAGMSYLDMEAFLMECIRDIQDEIRGI